MARAYPIISPLRELRHALSDLRLNDLSVGDDGRNRTPLWAFGSKTGRNQPSNSKYIFGPSVWLRGLIKPPPGYAVAYIDWSSQEVGIAAVARELPHYAWRQQVPKLLVVVAAPCFPSHVPYEALQ
jgi:DNA polymerase I